MAPRIDIQRHEMKFSGYMLKAIGLKDPETIYAGSASIAQLPGFTGSF